MSQANLEGTGGKAGLNYEAMPVGKKSVLAPINVLNTQLDSSSGNGGAHPALFKMENPNSQIGVVNRKNNRTLKPLQRWREWRRRESDAIGYVDQRIKRTYYTFWLYIH